MGLLAFLVIVIIVGFIVWLAITFVPMPQQFKTALPIIALVILLVILLVYMLGGGDIQIPKVR
jgi:hypothetical protein